MNKHVQLAIDSVLNISELPDEEKNTILQALKEVDKAYTILDFKLNRAQKENRTTSILLDETIDELQRKSLVLEQANVSLSKAYEDLKATQTQLIQSEKMASLGELTAGIAHEIQNPLNFVNNFAEVSEELCEELLDEINRAKLPDEDKKPLTELMGDILQNQQKIKFHGNRADSIIKNMLLHSRVNTGQNEPTDINSLAEEYLRLSYHGLRAKDKSFNAILKTEFSDNLPKIDIIPQDIGRVLLNLFNNAFYAVQQQKKLLNHQFQPQVQVITTMLDGKLEIIIKDNGGGIPENVKNKIFQPFFTTKPPGQGTGLGLSISYDIIKAHGGEIKVTTEEGVGSAFLIQLRA